jgi:hypothetical protein
MFSEIDQFDKDGAIQETRASFLKKAGVGAGALIGGGAFMGALPALAGASTKVAASDVAILNYALTLEYLEAAFYNAAVKGRALKGDAAKFAKIVRAHENAHVAFLKKALGSSAVKQPSFDFKGTTMNQGKFLATAQVLEDTGVAAYLGQVGNIKSKTILGAAGSILPVEARHAGWVRELNHVSGAPAAFEGGSRRLRS